MKKDGKWEYYSGEDPGLKYLYQKGIITQEEYDKGLRVIENKERVSRLNFGVDVNNGLNFRVGDRVPSEAAYSSPRCDTRTVRTRGLGDGGRLPQSGDSGRPGGVPGGQASERFKLVSVPRARLQFMGYAFDPDFRYNVSWAIDHTTWDQEGGNGRARLLDAYVSSWHIPWLTVQARAAAGLVQPCRN